MSDTDSDRDSDKRETISLSDESERKNSGDSIAVGLSFDGVVERFENPKETIDSISAWAEHVGIVSGKPQHVINGFCAKRDIDLDFFSGPKDEEGKLHGLKRAKESQLYTADRYVFIGASRRDEVVAEKAGWEFLHVEDASKEADWKLK